MGPPFVLVKVGVTTDEVGGRIERVSQHSPWTVERVSVTVRPACEHDLDVRIAGGFPERQCTHLAPHLSDNISYSAWLQCLICVKKILSC